GAFDFVTKPVDFGDLETTINKTILEIDQTRSALKEHDQLMAIQYDLSIARNIQHSILPKTFPPFPDRSEFEIFASMNAAREVGGDFYDFFMISKDKLGFVMADVSGKGIPAAIFMAVSRTLLKATAMKGQSPGDALSHVNNMLCVESVASMFVTVFYGVLDINTGYIEYVNGGHNPPMIMRYDGCVETLPLTNGMALGLFEDNVYKSEFVKLNCGDSIFLYTDGVTEAFNCYEDLYSDDRLELKLKEAFSAQPEEVCKFILSDVNEFSAGVDQSDDITMLALKYLKP
ncbi:MAG: SpoIIE family protein phosphatase, partial [Syntrophothermus sp.]